MQLSGGRLVSAEPEAVAAVQAQMKVAFLDSDSKTEIVVSVPQTQVAPTSPGPRMQSSAAAAATPGSPAPTGSGVGGFAPTSGSAGSPMLHSETMQLRLKLQETERKAVEATRRAADFEMRLRAQMHSRLTGGLVGHSASTGGETDHGHSHSSSHPNRMARGDSTSSVLSSSHGGLSASASTAGGASAGGLDDGQTASRKSSSSSTASLPVDDIPSNNPGMSLDLMEFAQRRQEKLEMELLRMRREIESGKRRLAKAEEAASTAAHAKLKAEERSAHLLSENEQLRKSLDALQSEKLVEYDKKFHEMSSLLSAAKEGSRAQKAIIDSLQAENEVLARNNANLRAETDGLSCRLGDVQDELAAIKEKMEIDSDVKFALAQRVDAAIVEKQEMADLNRRMKGELDAAMNALMAVRRELAEAKDQLRRYKSGLLVSGKDSDSGHDAPSMSSGPHSPSAASYVASSVSNAASGNPLQVARRVPNPTAYIARAIAGSRGPSPSSSPAASAGLTDMGSPTGPSAASAAAPRGALPPTVPNASLMSRLFGDSG